MSNFNSYQTMAIPEGGTSNAAPDGYRSATVNAQPGAVTINADGTATTHRPQSVSAADFTTGASGILAKARTAQGSPSMGGIKPTDIITVDGFELTVEMAEQHGMVTRDANGRYVEVGGGVKAAQDRAEPQEEAPVDDAQAFADPKAEAALGDLANSVAPSHHIAAIQDVIQTGTISELTINRAASEAGREPSAIAGEASKVMESFKAQAVTAVQSWGSDDPMEFFTWAQQEKPREFREAMQAHGMERSTKGYQPLYQEFVAGIAERDPEFVLASEFGGGITARKDGKAVILNIPGRGEMTLRQALRVGAVKVSGA